ncbi:MAG: hypothetical protein K6T65_15155, partial [Peptococcaceae bacterium]|nr:hypothetical protein [Peptococcaceae bacterium]
HQEWMECVHSRLPFGRIEDSLPESFGAQRWEDVSVAYAVIRDPVIFLLAKIVVLVETLRCWVKVGG